MTAERSESSLNCLPLLSTRFENFLGCIIFRKPTRATWWHFFLACNPRYLRRILAGNICVLFTLCNWCISCYYQSQLPTFAATLKCQKGFQVNIQQIYQDLQRQRKIHGKMFRLMQSYIYIYIYRDIGPAVRVFANVVESYQRL